MQPDFPVTTAEDRGQGWRTHGVMGLPPCSLKGEERTTKTYVDHVVAQIAVYMTHNKPSKTGLGLLTVNLTTKWDILWLENVMVSAAVYKS